MKLKLEADFEYYGHWTFTLLIMIVSLLIAYFSLKAQDSVYSANLLLALVVSLVAYLLIETKYNKIYNTLRKKLKGEDKMPKSKFLKFVFDKTHIMNYTYGFFGSIFAALLITFTLKQFPKDMYSWYVLSIIGLITYVVGLFCVSLIAFAFSKK